MEKKKCKSFNISVVCGNAHWAGKWIWWNDHVGSVPNFKQSTSTCFTTLLCSEVCRIIFSSQLAAGETNNHTADSQNEEAFLFSHWRSSGKYYTFFCSEPAISHRLTDRGLLTGSDIRSSLCVGFSSVILSRTLVFLQLHTAVPGFHPGCLIYLCDLTGCPTSTDLLNSQKLGRPTDASRTGAHYADRASEFWPALSSYCNCDCNKPRVYWLQQRCLFIQLKKTSITDNLTASIEFELAWRRSPTLVSSWSGARGSWWMVRKYE